MNDFSNYTDVNYSNIPTDEECIINAVQIGKVIGEPPSTIRVWAERHQEFLYIKKINGRFSYTQASINQFKFIQTLIRDKKFTHELVHEQLSKRGFEYEKYSSGLINLDDPLGFEALASQLAIKNGEQLKEFLMRFMEYQENFKKELKEELKTEVAVSVDEHLEDKLNEFKSEMQIFIDQRELEYKKQDEEKISMLKAHMEDTKKKNEEDNSKKGIWSRIFNK